MNDVQLLAALEAEIPVLEEKLRAMKVSRQRLRSAARMRKMRKNPAFKKKMRAAMAERWTQPEVREHFMSVRHTGKGGPLPWREGTSERKLYDKLRYSGFSREAAIANIRAEAP